MIDDRANDAAVKYSKEQPFGGQISYSAFLAGVKWMMEQGVTFEDKIYPCTDNEGNIEGYCIDGEGELDACDAGVQDKKFELGDKVIVQIYKK